MVAWSTTAKSSSITLTNSNLTATHNGGSGDNAMARADTAITASQKKFWASTINNDVAAAVGPGITNTTETYPTGRWPGETANSIGFYPDGSAYHNYNGTGSPIATGLSTWGDGDIVDVAVDEANTKVWIRVNGGNWNNNATHNPATNTGGINYGGLIGSGDIYPACNVYTPNGQLTANFGASGFTHAPPSGFTGLESGGTTESGAGSATATGTATGVGRRLIRGAGSATAAGTATGAGRSLHRMTGTATGTGTAAGVGRAQHRGAGSATAQGTAAATGRELRIGAGSATAAGTAAATGQTLAVGVGAAAGVGSAAGLGAGSFQGTGAAAATSDAQGAGQGNQIGVGAAAGMGDAQGEGVGEIQGTGEALGSSAAAGQGLTVSIVTGTGAALGTGDAQAAGSGGSIAIGIAVGTSGAAAIGEEFQLPEPLAWPLQPPPEFCPRRLQIAARNTTAQTDSPTTGQEIRAATEFERWEWEIELPAMRALAGEQVVGFLESLRGKTGFFEFGNPKKKLARGSARASHAPVVNTGDHTDREIPVSTNLATNVKGWLRAGDMVSLGLPGDELRRLFRVLRDVDLIAGVGVIDVWPGLGSELSIGQMIHVEGPTTMFRLDTNDVEHEIDENGFYHFQRIPIVQWRWSVANPPDEGVRFTTGQATGSGDAAGAGMLIARGVGLALATSTAEGIAQGNIGVAQGVGTAAGVGRSITIGVGAAAGMSTATGIGGTGSIVTGTGAASATSTAFGAAVVDGGEGDIVADGEFMTLSIDGVSYGPAP